AGLLPGRSIRSALAERTGFDFVLLPGEAINEAGRFIDDLSAEELAAGLPVPVRFSKDFCDALEMETAA
ncbi:MAG TPA: hypothetical protein VFN96_04155, partial [Gemmatimonadales bacterium]|nr:hypothetical protein [Gemmatimonadales bacterium]